MCFIFNLSNTLLSEETNNLEKTTKLCNTAVTFTRVCGPTMQARPLLKKIIKAE